MPEETKKQNKDVSDWNSVQVQQKDMVVLEKAQKPDKAETKSSQETK